jgi:hypothetical protein
MSRLMVGSLCPEWHCYRGILFRWRGRLVCNHCQNIFQEEGGIPSDPEGYDTVHGLSEANLVPEIMIGPEEAS